MLKRLICQTLSYSTKNSQPFSFLRTWKALCLAGVTCSLTLLVGLSADTKPMPGSKSTKIEILTPADSVVVNAGGSSPIEIIKGNSLPEPARVAAPPAEPSPYRYQSEAPTVGPKQPTFSIRKPLIYRKPRRKSNLPSLESLIGGKSAQKKKDNTDDTAPASGRKVKRDPYFEKILAEAAAKQLELERIEKAKLAEQARLKAEQAKLEQERLAEEQRLEEIRLAEEKRQASIRLAEEKRLEEERKEKERIAAEEQRIAAAQAEAQARILALPPALLDLPKPEVQKPFVPIPRVVHRTTVVIKSVPDWLVMKKVEEPILGRVQVTRLLSRARLELAAGDLLMAHTFAEAAAEIEISIELFSKKPKLILAEIEYVTSRRLAKAVNTLVTYDETVGKKVEPDTFAKSLQEDPRAYRSLSSQSLNIKPPAENSSGDALELPNQQAKLRMAQLPVIFQDTGHGRGWGSMSYSWEAPAVKYSPLYFEQHQLERYGNEFCLGMQPLVSGLGFFLTIPSLPYQMGIEGNGICAEVYDLGYERPESCVPYSIRTLPFSWTGVATQAAATTGLVFILP